jgi:hypothetical protein
VHGLPDHVVDLGDQAGPVPIAFVVPGLAGQPGALPQRGVEDRDRFRQRDRQVEEQRARPSLPDGLEPQFTAAFGGGMRLGGQQRGVQVGGLAAAAHRPPQLGSVRCFALAEQQVIGFAIDPLPGLEAERFSAGAPPAAWWLSPALAGLDVIAGRVLGRTTVDLLPDVVKVIALAQRRHNRHPANPPPAGTAELPMLIGWCMGVEARTDHAALELTLYKRVAKTADQDQKRESH